LCTSGAICSRRQASHKPESGFIPLASTTRTASACTSYSPTRIRRASGFLTFSRRTDAQVTSGKGKQGADGGGPNSGQATKRQACMPDLLRGLFGHIYE
jgi:hypothetical protein